MRGNWIKSFRRKGSMGMFDWSGLSVGLSYEINEDQLQEEITECQKLIKFLEREQILRLTGV